MKFFKIYGIVSGVSYFLWWWGFYFLLPLDEIMENYPALINHRFWIPVNLLQVSGVLFFFLFLLEFIKRYFQNKLTAEILKILTAVGVFGLSGIAFYETFLWPSVAANAPELLLLKNSPIYSGSLFLISTGTIILSFMISSIYIGILMRRESAAAGIVFGIGIFLFCMGYMAGEFRYILQSFGLTGWTAALVYYGFINLSEQRF
ncbi:MAG: hypothetical protein OEZ34_16405 [Spirochaetia bacterium]|nr:hypothetical protein [Spirochaetia bacterium]